MGRKKQRTTLDDAQSQEDYELLLAENEKLEQEPTQSDSTKSKTTTTSDHSTTSLLDLPPLHDENEETSVQRNYTYGELDFVGSRVLGWIRSHDKKRDELPVTKLGLQEAIADQCHVTRKIPFVGIYQVLDLIGVLETKPLEGQEPSLDPNPTLRSPDIEANISKIVSQVELHFVDDWTSIVDNRKTRKFLREKLTPVQQHCFPKIFEALKQKEIDGELPNYSDSILRTLSDLGEFEENIPPEDLIEWLQEEELIVVHEKSKTNKVGKSVSTYSIEYSKKIWSGKGISLSQVVLWALFVLVVVGAIFGKTG